MSASRRIPLEVKYEVMFGHHAGEEGAGPCIVLNSLADLTELLAYPFSHEGSRQLSQPLFDLILDDWGDLPDAGNPDNWKDLFLINYTLRATGEHVEVSIDLTERPLWDQKRRSWVCLDDAALEDKASQRLREIQALMDLWRK